VPRPALLGGLASLRRTLARTGGSRSRRAGRSGPHGIALSFTPHLICVRGIEACLASRGSAARSVPGRPAMGTDRTRPCPPCRGRRETSPCLVDPELLERCNRLVVRECFGQEDTVDASGRGPRDGVHEEAGANRASRVAHRELTREHHPELPIHRLGLSKIIVGVPSLGAAVAVLARGCCPYEVEQVLGNAIHVDGERHAAVKTMANRTSWSTS
jgi:hypothetical protein